MYYPFHSNKYKYCKGESQGVDRHCVPGAIPCQLKQAAPSRLSLWCQEDMAQNAAEVPRRPDHDLRTQDQVVAAFHKAVELAEDAEKP